MCDYHVAVICQYIKWKLANNENVAQKFYDCLDPAVLAATLKG